MVWERGPLASAKDKVDLLTVCLTVVPPTFVFLFVSLIGLESMKLLSIADWTGIIETELFAKTYRIRVAWSHGDTKSVKSTSEISTQ
jgi:hypothetical protein